MTNEERKVALSIINEYRVVEEKLQRISNSIDRLERKNEIVLTQLENIKSKEKQFMEDYRKKYGDKDVLSDINRIVS
jgi:uncharacterized protein YoxC